MYQSILQETLARWSDSTYLSLLNQMRRGYEKEALRVDRNSGELCQDRHPEVLGSALTHAEITTDFAENLIEFVTPAETALEGPLSYLAYLHQYTARHLSNDILWPASMPPAFRVTDEIKIAEYGTSNSGRMKHLYRRGLALRYGKPMQIIAGIHYNFSWSNAFWRAEYDACKAVSASPCSLREFTDQRYFRVLRNLQRYSWLFVYLFGASPLCDASFTAAGGQIIQKSSKTMGLKCGSALRLSDCGYQNSAQSNDGLRLDNLSHYIADLEKAIRTPDANYAQIGQKNSDGQYQQINVNQLQIENEFYGLFRPKRQTRSGERPTLALRQGGVDYLEIRMLDINPMLPYGVDLETQAFVDLLLMLCLAIPDESLDFAASEAQINQNLQTAIYESMNPNSEICCPYTNERHTLPEAAEMLLQKITPFAELLDKAYQTDLFSRTLQKQHDKVSNQSLLPAMMQIESLGSMEYHDGIMKMAIDYDALYSNAIIPNVISTKLDQMASQSHYLQAQLESSDTLTFEAFLANYFQEAV